MLCLATLVDACYKLAKALSLPIDDFFCHTLRNASECVLWVRHACTRCGIQCNSLVLHKPMCPPNLEREATVQPLYAHGEDSWGLASDLTGFDVLCFLERIQRYKKFCEGRA
jgi:hypothetical protein